MTTFSIGQRVMRMEDRAERGATVIADEIADMGEHYLIVYDEGGEGWWPRDALEAEA